jgi:hypothetical protein
MTDGWTKWNCSRTRRTSSRSDFCVLTSSERPPKAQFTCGCEFGFAAMGWGSIETLDLIFKKLPEHTFLTGRYIKNSPSIRKIFTIESFCALLCLSSPVVAFFSTPDLNGDGDRTWPSSKQSTVEILDVSVDSRRTAKVFALSISSWTQGSLRFFMASPRSASMDGHGLARLIVRPCNGLTASVDQFLSDLVKK